MTMQPPRASDPPPPTAVEIDEARDEIRITVPIELFRRMQPMQLASIERSTLFLNSAHAARIRQLVSQGPPRG